MCGIWGVIKGPRTSLFDMRKFLGNSLVAGTVRGDHGAGLMLLPNIAGPAHIVKAAESGDQLIYREPTQRMLSTQNLASMWAVIGHNRAATVGDISDEATHPFQHGNITLVHNGGVSSPGQLPGVKKWNVNRVDSDGICESIAASGYEETLKHTYGAYALAWHDAEQNVLRLVRNAQRPLHFMRTACGALLLASEGDMLWWLAGRAGFQRGSVRELKTHLVLTIPKEGKIEATPAPIAFYQPPPFRERVLPVVYTTPANGANSGGDSVSLWRATGLDKLGLTGNSVLEFTIEEIEAHHGNQFKYRGTAVEVGDKELGIVHAVMFGHAQAALEVGVTINARPTGMYKADKKARNSTLPTIVVRPIAGNGVKIEPEQLYPGPKGEMISRSDWLRETSRGCVQCRQSLCLPDADKIAWMINQTQPMCEKCQDELTDWGRSETDHHHVPKLN